MSENPLSISNLNDFIFCPVSIYFHEQDRDTERMAYQDAAQLNGTAAHEKSDTAAYSAKKSMLQGISVYSEKLNLIGKIDTFDTEKGILTERKKRISTVYDGYVFQLFGQYYALTEMGYKVRELRLYSMDDHKTFPVPSPEEAPDLQYKFHELLREIASFRFDLFSQSNPSKCARCIYEPICSYSIREKEYQ